jgi:nucleotide-binding universal stress UspA family protein
MQQHAIFQRLLLPLDGSPLAERAVPAAVELAERLRVPARLLFVVVGWDQVAQTFARVNDEVDMELHGRMLHSSDVALQAVHGYLNGQARAFTERGLEATTSVGHGVAADEIVAEAHREPGTCIVMTTHGRGGLSRVVMGSTAQAVVQRTEVPVIMLRSR